MEKDLLFSAKPISECLYFGGWLVDFLLKWQTLVGSFIAVLTPFVFWYFIEKKREEKRKKARLIEVEKSLALTLHDLFEKISSLNNNENFAKAIKLPAKIDYDSMNEVFFNQEIFKYDFGTYFNEKIIQYHKGSRDINFNIRLKRIDYLKLKENMKMLFDNILITKVLLDKKIREKARWKKSEEYNNSSVYSSDIVENTEKYFAEDVKGQQKIWENAFNSSGLKVEKIKK